VSCLKGARLCCDNMGTKYPVFHGRMKHIEMNYHFIRDQVMKKLLDVRFISTHDQVADGFAKPLPQHRMLEFRNILNLAKS
jgi:hypothetical protein